MDLDDFGLLSILFILPYAIALQILLITFVRKYIDSRREILRMKQDLYNREAVAAGRVYQPAPHAPAAQNVPVMQPAPANQPAAVAQPAPAFQAAPQVQPAIQQAPVSQPVQKKKARISSTSITFGVGVLLLTIVGAAFLSVSWNFMGNGARAVTLIAAVAVVYFLSFLSGKVLKLKQTGFAFYTLGSFLGPIVIVGVGMFKLLGKWFSFSSGNGWMVAAVAAGLMGLSALLGKYIYKSKFYNGITYFSFTWLLVFIAGQIGEASSHAYPYECVFIAVAVLALVLRIMNIINGDSLKTDFKIYSEIITFGASLMMIIMIPVAIDDGSKNTFLLIGSIPAFAALILHAKFTPKREWVKYLAPFAAMCIYLELICFDFKYPRSVWMVIAFFAALYLVFFFTKMRTLLSDILFTSLLALTVLALDSIMDTIYVPVIVAAGISVIMSGVSAYCSKNKPSGVINAALAGVWFFIMSVETMLSIFGDKDEFLYFLLVLPVPVAASIVLTVLRRFWKDDHRIRAALEVLMWTALLFGMIYLIGTRDLTWRGGLPITFFAKKIFIKVLANGILLFIDSLLIACNYYFGAKKKETLSIPSIIVFALALNSPAFVVFVPGIVLDLLKTEHHAFEVAFSVMLAVMAGALVLIRFAPLFKKEKVQPYARPLRHIVSALLITWSLFSMSFWNVSWMIVAFPLVVLALYLCGNEFLAFLPVLLMEFALGEFFTSVVRIPNKDLYNLEFILLILGQIAIGRLLFKMKVFSGEGIDYLAFMPAILLIGLKDTDYKATVIYLILALMIFNFIGRTRTPARIIASLATIPVAAALIDQDYINLSEVYMTELYMVVILADAAIIRFLIKPAEQKLMKYCWFAIVSGCIVVEGISAAITGYTFDLIVTGVAAGGIFLISFIQKSRLWFILGVVSIIGIAVYLSATFWSSMAWLLYLLIAGVIMIGIAAGNEWRKRHSSDGKKLFKEWKW